MESTNGDSTSNGSFPCAKLLSKQRTSNEYIMHLAVNNQVQAQLAIVLSNHEVIQLDLANQDKRVSYKSHEKSITGIKFSKETPSLFFTCSVDGKIIAWDTRSGTMPVQTFLDDTDGPLKPFTCFDLNSDETVLCAGTELIREDSFLIFWDKRTSNSLGGYWNSHTDEITHVQFNCTCNSELASSSVDGLINIFDLTENAEEDALVNTLNAETSVNRFTWGPNNHISCITGTEDYQFWLTEQTKPSVSMNREDLSDNFQCRVDYLIDTFRTNQSFYLASGTNDGTVQLYSQKKKHLKPVAMLENSHTDVVRAVSHVQSNRFVTGGEDGQLCTWKISL